MHIDIFTLANQELEIRIPLLVGMEFDSIEAYFGTDPMFSANVTISTEDGKIDVTSDEIIIKYNIDSSWNLFNQSIYYRVDKIKDDLHKSLQYGRIFITPTVIP